MHHIIRFLSKTIVCFIDFGTYNIMHESKLFHSGEKKFFEKSERFFPNAHLINWTLVSSFHINVNLHMFFFIYLDSTLNLTAILKWERNGIKGMHLQNSMPTYIRSIVFFVCVLLNTMHLFGMKNAFFKVGTIYAWVCRELVFKSAQYDGAVVGYFQNSSHFIVDSIHDLCASGIRKMQSKIFLRLF